MILFLQLALMVVVKEAEADSIGYRSNTFNIKKIHPSTSFSYLPLAFAAALKGGNKKGGGGGQKKKQGGGSTASSNRGFGIAPPTYEEVLNSFQTRLPPNAEESICPCGGTTGDGTTTYANCCKPYHVGEKTCQTIVDVLKTRYTAFSYRLIDHVIRTTHETSRDYMDDKIAWAKDLNKSGMFDSYDFVELTVHGKEEYEPNNDNIGYIEFSVLLRDKGSGKGVAENGDDILKGKETLITERSKFIRNPDTGIWSYASGDVRSNVAGLEDTILNQ